MSLKYVTFLLFLPDYTMRVMFNNGVRGYSGVHTLKKVEQNHLVYFLIISCVGFLIITSLCFGCMASQ